MTSLTQTQEDHFWKLAFWLAIFTIGYNLIEGLVSVYLGAQDEALTLFVNCTDVDDVDEDDALGTVDKTFARAQNWGAGAHSDRSLRPNDYTIHYRITVTQP